MFSDRVVIITGSTRGIGKATAIKFIQNGDKVVINSKSSYEEGAEFLKEIKGIGGEAIYLQGDLSNPSEVSKLFASVINIYSRIDVLINNAGRTQGEEFLEADKEHWLKMFDDNFLTAVLCSKEAAKIMLEQGNGKIINNASIRGIDYCGGENLMAYSASKAALISFTKSLAKFLAPLIHVNAIVPGFVYTPRFETYPKELKDAFVKATAIKRFISAEEIADAIFFIANCTAMTGQVLTIDGGFTLKMA